MRPWASAPGAAGRLASSADERRGNGGERQDDVETAEPNGEQRGASGDGEGQEGRDRGHGEQLARRAERNPGGERQQAQRRPEGAPSIAYRRPHGLPPSHLWFTESLPMIRWRRGAG